MSDEDEAILTIPNNSSLLVTGILTGLLRPLTI